MKTEKEKLEEIVAAFNLKIEEKTLEFYRECFEETQNPAILTLAFEQCHLNKIPQPEWVLNEIAGIFTELHRSQGSADLNRLFGLKTGKGRGTPFKAFYKIRRDLHLTFEITRLRVLLGVSISGAASMVEKRLRVDPKEDIIEYKYLAGMYCRNKSKIRAAMERFISENRLPGDDITLLQNYPSVCYPDSVKKRYRIK